MKSINSSNRPVKTPSHRLSIACALAVGLLAGGVHSAYAAVLVFDVQTVSIAPTAKFDLKNEALIVRTTPYATVEGYVKTGFNAFNWNGFGIQSSNAATFVDPTAVGIADNSDAFYATYFGIAIGADDALARYTYYGDADLNGKVDNDDYALIDAGFSGGANRWFLGDFDYNNVINNDDYALIDAGFSGQGAPLGGGGGFLAGGGEKSALVPEPASAALLLLGAVGFASRRRR